VGMLSSLESADGPPSCVPVTDVVLCSLAIIPVGIDCL
jgi:hypothetical protein